ncbi:conjugal transfer protein TraF [Sphingobium sp. HWE2-09]|uniref:conjugal transfer protein TraF n=1 Tax=Sphingobium sp. HWE2-09 TaxID=3108390 RepID=UPI002DC72319|nr:conjugal transfer protein TraF [Sphingobium sp. HWE2-09]
MKRALALLALAGLLLPTAAVAEDVIRQGYWWYRPKADPAETLPEDVPPAPVIPPMAELTRWSPPRIAKLITDQRDYAATVLTVEAVSNFWRLEDFARRKARAFAGLTQLAMLAHPELSAKSANPMIGDARAALGAQKDAVRRAYLRTRSPEFALVMFSRTSCGYCRVQWPILQRFQEETGWQIIREDLDRRPELSARFGVEVTPTTMVIRRNSVQRMVIANGVEAFPTLIQTAYQAVKLLSGDIRPEQFLTGAGEENGFFDALANGPVAAADPMANPGGVRP